MELMAGVTQQGFSSQSAFFYFSVIPPVSKQNSDQKMNIIILMETDILLAKSCFWRVSGQGIPVNKKLAQKQKTKNRNT